MFFPQLRASLRFFWQYLTPLLGRLLPVLLPLLLAFNYRFFFLFGADAEKAMQDPLSLLLQLLVGLAANTLTILYTVAVLQGGDTTLPTLWRQAVLRLPALFFLQILVGLAIILGLLALILPGLYLMGVLLPAYVLVVYEKQSIPAALRDAWQRFRGRPWELSASFLLVLSGLLIVVSGLKSLQALLDSAALPLRVAAAAGLDLVGVLFMQLLVILLVHTWYAVGQDAQKDKQKSEKGESSV
ncbi:MAG: hypothetical protein ACRERR_14065 [Moraxellaceae bacterium]